MRIVLFLLLFCVTSLYSETGTSSANFLKIIPSAKVRGNADSLGIFGRDIGMTRLNPAIINEMVAPNIFGFHRNGYFDSAYEFIGFNLPTKIGHWSISVLYFHSSDFSWYNNDSEIINTFSEKDISLVLNYGYPIIEKKLWELSGGINLNFIHQDIAGANDKTLAADIGIMGKFNFLKFYKNKEKNIVISSTLRNVGGKIKVNYLPLIINSEVGYQFIRYIALVNHFVFYNKEDLQYNLALESNYSFLILRLGKTFSKIRNNYTTGLGIKVSDNKTDYIFDYALVSSQIMDELNHCFSLSITL